MYKMIYQLVVLPFTVLLLVFSSCSENPTTAPAINDPIKTMELSAIHTTCTETWLRIKSDISVPQALVTLVGDSIEYNFLLNSKDTVIYYPVLKAGQEYEVQVVSKLTKSNKVTIKTLNTTSSNVVWDVKRIGDSNELNVVNDVAIINENDMWFVGEFYRGDSLFNVIHYNGSTVEYLRIYYEEGGIKSLGKQYCIKVFEDGEIWFASGHIKKLKNGVVTSWKVPDSGFSEIIKEIIGTKDDFYVIGDNGAIAHYENGKWTKIPTNTGLPIQDIHGAYNAKGEYEIYAVAGNKGMSLEHRIYKIEGNTIKPVFDGGIKFALDGVWFTPGGDYYVVGDGIFRKSVTTSDNKDWENLSNGLTNKYSLAINGTAVNDIFVANAFGEVLHFNGIRWTNYSHISGFSTMNIIGIAIKGNTVVVYGIDVYGLGAVAIGRRN